MKKFFKEYLWLIPVVIFVLAATGIWVYRLYADTINLWNASNENIGTFILNIVKIPFAIFGAINVFRGFCAVLEKDTDKFGFKKYWHFVIYFVVMLLSYGALFLL